MTSHATPEGSFPGVVSHPSPHPFDDTLARLDAALSAKSMTVFARIDQAAAAREAGLALRPTVLVLFGNPRGGTPIMQAVPEAALDLPLKALVWEDDGGQVWLTFLDPAALGERWGLSAAQLMGIQGSVSLLEGVVKV